jgi:opacity protein-like surface antigen
MRFKILCATLAVPAVAAAVGAYFNGGLASFGDLETEFTYRGFTGSHYEDLGTSYYVGGGFAVPIWSRRGAVSPSLELATDVGFTSKAKEITYQLGYQALPSFKLSFKAIPILENIIFGVTVGPAKPFVGFGAGVAVVPWEFTQVSNGAELDSQTEVKAAFGIPFGCEFRLTPNVALGVRAEYAVITGGATPEIPLESVRVHALMPDPFVFAGVARVDF